MVSRRNQQAGCCLSQRRPLQTLSFFEPCSEAGTALVRLVSLARYRVSASHDSLPICAKIESIIRAVNMISRYGIGSGSLFLIDA